MRNFMSRHLMFLLVSSLMLFIYGCSGDNHTAPISRNGKGTLQVRIHWPARTAREIPSGSDLATITVSSVNEPDMVIPPQTISVSSLATTSLATFYALPAGACTVEVETFTSSSTPAPVVRGRTGAITDGYPPTAVGYVRVNVGAGQTASASVCLAALHTSFLPPTQFVTIRQGSNGHTHLFAIPQIGADPIDLTPTSTDDCSQPALSTVGQYVCYISHNDGVLHFATLSSPLSSTNLPVFQSYDMTTSTDPMLPPGTITSPAWSPPSASPQLAYIVNPTDTTLSPYLVTCSVDGSLTPPMALLYQPSSPYVPTAVTWYDPYTLLVVEKNTTSGTENLYKFPLNAPPLQNGLLSSDVPAGTITSPTVNIDDQTIAYLKNGTLSIITNVLNDPFTIHPSGLQSISWYWDNSELRLLVTYQPVSGIAQPLGLFRPLDNQPALITSPGSGDQQCAAAQMLPL